MNSPDPYIRRFADDRLAALLTEFPAVLITGPRAVGKTRTAERRVADVVRLDEPAAAAAFRIDPDAALRNRGEPLLLDEWQEVPEVLGAVKRAVDADSRPNRFVLTGSVRATVQQAMWPGTGRLVRLEMFGMSEAEVRDVIGTGRPTFVDRLQQANPAAFTVPDTDTRVDDYLRLALRSGFPELATRTRSAEAHEIWLDSYIEQMVTRDAHSLVPHADSGRLRRYLEVLALSTAGVPTAATLYEAAGINAKTARSYDEVLESLAVTEQIPAWSSNRLNRLTKLPKRYVVDPALAAAAARLSERGVLSDGDLLGRFVDSFAMAQLRPDLAASGARGRMHHLRTKEGRQEIDLVIEIGDGRVLALEFKASAAPSRHDARHLRWLRDQIGDRFVVGAVLHTGPDVFELDRQILAVPYCALWG